MLPHGNAIATKDNVFQAANDLKRDGIAPTQTLVRERLGNRGSFATINEHLRAWREEEARIPDITDKLPDDIKQVMDKSYEGFILQLWKLVEQHVNREKQGMQITLAGHEQELARREAIIIDHESTMERQSKETQEARQQAATYLEDRRHLETEGRIHLERIRELDTDTKNLRLAVDAAKAELSAKVISYETQLAVLKSEQKTAVDALAQVKVELALQQDSRRAAEAELTRVQADLRSQTQVLTQVKTELSSAIEGRRTAEADLTRVQADLGNQIEKFGELTKEYRAIKTELSETKEGLSIVQESKDNLLRERNELIVKLGESEKSLAEALKASSALQEQIVELKAQSRFEERLNDLLETKRSTQLKIEPSSIEPKGSEIFSGDRNSDGENHFSPST